ncbi:Gfo/Idh/MocA family protein [Fuerstiella marisgermanici]|uniref:Inositol 2-dehydrogenase n=1 Tax=Fuerstiella marisgermanici TaxID=1891926 RepID=A0A1P8WIP2_9PLAN|nr:Gfo/Idh/MocA family oxidoreductase [Fuerstiella marisgermanici]APZ93916.1 Inositol 2-dehydrogenase [Fuerstiella marisgermanici]
MTQSSRRQFVKSTSVAALTAGVIPWFAPASRAATFRSANDRPVLGCIGTGSRWGAVGPNALKFSDCVAVCDADANHAGKAKERVKGIQAKRQVENDIEVHEDYRKVLDRNDIDIVTIVTPDHWHTKIAIEAMKAGKDVYCEKPLTLTIDEGKQIRKVLDETGRVFQVGTQQRSEMGLKFLHAVALVREGRIGDVKKATVAIGGAPTSGEIPEVDVPKGLNWDLWLGQAPEVAYRFKENGKWGNSRCHYEFRWWYEYSGGKMTDWGAHHVDIASWALDVCDTGPTKVEPIMAVHPVEFKDGHPLDDTQYNTATKFHVKTTFANGATLDIREKAQDLGFDNGIMLEGTEGRIFVNRGKLTGAAVDGLKDKPLKEETLKTLYKGKEPGDHMRNFFECVADRTQPISDVHTHHRAMTTCHLANIAIRLDRTLNWDPEKEQIVGDEAAAMWQAREQRKGYEIEV